MARGNRRLATGACTVLFAGAAVLTGCKPQGATAARQFFGVVTEAPKVAYVIEGSGSMIDSIMYVKRELKRSIRQLKPNQMFYVAFASSGPAREMPARKLVPATEANKQAACEFIDSYVPAGQTDLTDSLRRAFEVGAEVIYVLSDGEFEERTVDLVDRLNSDRKVKVNTVCFLYASGEMLLKEIARRNGGTYKYVSEDDLERIGK